LLEFSRALAPEGIFYERAREFRGQKNRTSAAKAEFRSAIYGTAEAVPFRDRVLTQTLKAHAHANLFGTTEVVL
jgi:hypothetical protein